MNRKSMRILLRALVITPSVIQLSIILAVFSLFTASSSDTIPAGASSEINAPPCHLKRKKKNNVPTSKKRMILILIISSLVDKVTEPDPSLRDSTRLPHSQRVCFDISGNKRVPIRPGQAPEFL